MELPETQVKGALTGFLLLLLTLASAVAPAAEVYRWVDDKGVVHFSDTLPEEAETEVDRLIVADRNPPGYDPAEDPNSVMNQAERVSERFAAIEKDRAEREAKRQQEINIYLSDPNRQSPYLFGYRNIYRPPLFPPQFPPPGPVRPSYRQQFNALAENDLIGPRPASINSGEHAARVQRSQALPLSLGPQPRPKPRPRSIRVGS